MLRDDVIPFRVMNSATKVWGAPGEPLPRQKLDHSEGFQGVGCILKAWRV